MKAKRILAVVVVFMLVISNFSFYSYGAAWYPNVNGYVWDDANENGALDDGENYVSGVAVTLTRVDGTEAPITKITDVNGWYYFGLWNQGEYQIKFSALPEGKAPTNNSVESLGVGPHSFTFDNNNMSFNYNLGLVEAAPTQNVKVLVWYDESLDRTKQDYEDVAAGVNLLLTDENANVSQAQTDSNGEHTFNNVKTGNYTFNFNNLPNIYQVGDIIVEGADDGAYISIPEQQVSFGVYDGSDVTIKVLLVYKEVVDEEGSGNYTIGDLVWYDSNGNGIQDGGEDGIEDITVTLTKSGSLLDQVETDGNGKYKFSGYPNGTYKVEFDFPEIYDITETDAGNNEELDSDGKSVDFEIDGKDNMTVDLGLVEKTYKIGDRVWEDKNENGIQDQGEEGIAGIKVLLCEAGETEPEDTAITDENGFYEFTGLSNDKYTVIFEIPDRYEITKTDAGDDDKLDSDGKSVVVRINEEDNMTVDLGLIEKTYKIGDRVWYDVNADGYQVDSEPGVQGVTVTLTKPNGDIETTTTDEDGYYYFFEPAANEYYNITFSDIPDQYEMTRTDAVANDDEHDSDGDTVEFTINDADNLTIDLGLIDKTANIGDYVWYDVNENGIQDVDEKGAQGVTVILTKSDGTAEETSTDENGHYEFAEVPNGEHHVKFSELPDGYKITSTHKGICTNDSDGLDADVSLYGVDNMDIDLGLVAIPVMTPSIGDYVWLDVNENGIQDANEVGAQGVMVTLKKADGTLLTTTTTDADGHYEFTDLIDNKTYTVEFTLPEGKKATKSNAGNVSNDSDGTTVSVTVVGGDRDDIDLGLVDIPTYKLGDYVWYDENGDGLQGRDERGAQDVTVTLRKTDGTVLKNTTTDENGLYEFSDLPNDDYLVVFSDLPIGYEATRSSRGNGENDSDGLNAEAIVYDADNMAVDLGIVEKLNIQVTKIWEGKAGNSATVNLLADGARVDTVVLDASNNWQHTFGNLKNFNDRGDAIAYTVTENEINGYTTEITGDVASGFIVKNTNTETVSVDVTKQWVGKAGESATINLLADGTKEDTVVLNAANSWQHTFRDLPKYNGENEIVYTVTEDAISGYTTEITGDITNGFVVKNTNTETVSFDVTKQWVDKTGNSATIRLLADGVETQSVELNQANSWKHSFTDLPKYKANKAIAYTVTEDAISGYATEITGDMASGFVVTNSNTETVSVDVEKRWKGKREDAATIKLLADGIEADSVVLNQGNDWKHRFTDLPKYRDDKAIAYTVEEKAIPGYASDIMATTGPALGFIITNSNTETVEINAKKIWVGGEEESATINIFANGTLKRSVKLVTDAWQKFVGFFAKYDSAGKEIEYTAEEHAIAGYTASYTKTTGAAQNSSGSAITFEVTNKKLAEKAPAKTYKLGGLVWEDADRDGVRDGAEVGVAGVTVSLKGANGNVLGTTQTDTNGNYFFAALSNGDYVVNFSELPNGYQVLDTADLVVASTIADADNLSINLGVVKKEQKRDVELTYSIGDYVWLDVNVNGIQDAEESGQAGVAVVLRDSSGKKISDALTDASGFYEFSGLANGDYTVAFSAPEGYVKTLDSQGDDRALDSNGLVAEVTIDDADDLTIDLGLIKPEVLPIKPKYSLGDYVWQDLNENGVQDTAEPGIAGVKVKLTQPDKTIALAETDLTGHYLFKNLDSGQYTVEFYDLPQKYQVTRSNVGGDDALDSDGLAAVVEIVNQDDLSVDLGLVYSEVPNGGSKVPSGEPKKSAKKPKKSVETPKAPTETPQNPVAPTETPQNPVVPTETAAPPRIVDVELPPVLVLDKVELPDNPAKNIYRLVDKEGEYIGNVKVKEDGSYVFVEDNAIPFGTIKLVDDKGTVELVDIALTDLPVAPLTTLPKTNEALPIGGIVFVLFSAYLFIISMEKMRSENE